MNLQSIYQDLEIEYYAMMSRVAQFARKHTLRNSLNVEIQRTVSLENPNAMVLVATNTERKNQMEAVATA